MRIVVLCGLVLILGMIGWAEPARSLPYHGRLSVAGRPFTGIGTFKFALLDAGGTRLWTSGTLRLAVLQGEYRLELGDAAFGVPAPVLQRADPLYLRIWFDDGVHGLAQLAPDQPLGAPTAQLAAELQQIRAMLDKLPIAAPTPAATPTPAPATVPLRGGHAMGSDTAPLTLVEFTDYQCAFCKQAAEELFPQLKAQFIDTGKVRFVSRNLPLAFHPHALKAAQAALFAGAQGQYWEMRRLLFAHQTALALPDLQRYARTLGLDVGKFTAALNGDTFLPEIRADLEDATAAGIAGTPSFVLGPTAKDALTGVRIVGAQPFAAFAAEINRQLAALQAARQ